MTKNRSPNRDKAFELYRSTNGKISVKEISEKLEEKAANIYSWKKRDNWDKKLKPGAPIGNKNALGNKGGAPEGNINGFKHGGYIPENRFTSKKFLAKYLPAATQSIIKSVVEEGLSSLDMLYDSIMLLYSSILRAQKIMHVKNHNDIVKEKKKQGWGDSGYDEWEIQFAWDRQERFIKSQATALKTLNKLINDYEILLHKNWDLATEEQKVRIEVLKSKVINDNKSKEDKIDEYFKKLEEVIKDDN